MRRRPQRRSFAAKGAQPSEEIDHKARYEYFSKRIVEKHHVAARVSVVIHLQPSLSVRWDSKDLTQSKGVSYDCEPSVSASAEDIKGFECGIGFW
jgi:hypothetical protein